MNQSPNRLVESRRAEEWRTAQRERYGERMRKLIRTHLVAILCLLLWPAPVFKDVVWPALILEPRLLSWWAIAVGLITEYLFIMSIFGLSSKRAVVVDIAANTVSTLLGIVLIPLAGVVWEFFLGTVFDWLMDSGTFNLISW